MKKQKVFVGGFGGIKKCSLCGKEDTTGIISWKVYEGEVCHDCLKTRCVELTREEMNKEEMSV